MSRMTLAALSDDLPEDGTEVEVGGAEAVVEEVGNGPEADLQEVASIDSELQAADVTIDEAADGAEALDGIAGAVDEANKEGGLDAPAAEAIRIAVEHISKRAGLEVPKRFAVEGFKSKTSRVQAGRLASEGIKEQAKKIWDMIVKMYEKVKAWVIKWFNNFFDGATKLKNRAEKLVKAAAAKVEGGSKVDAKDSKIVSPAYGDKLATKSGVPDAKSLSSDYTAGFGGGVTLDMVAADQAIIEKLLGSVDNAEAFKKNAEDLIASGKRAVGGKAVTDKKLGTPEGMETLQLTENTPGGRELFVHMPKVTTDAAASLGKVKYFVTEAPGWKVALKTDMVAAQPEDAKTIAEHVVKAADALIAQKKEVAGVEKGLDSIKSQAARLISASKDESKDRARQAAKIVRAQLSMLTNGVVAKRSLDIAVHGAVLSYVAASLALAGKEAAAA